MPYDEYGGKTPSRYSADSMPPDYTLMKFRYARDVQTLLELGRRAFAEEDYDMAAKYFQAALQIEPDNKLAYYFMKKTDYKRKRILLMRQRELEAHKIELEAATRPVHMMPCPDCGGAGVCKRCGGKGLCASCTGTGWRDLLGKQCAVCLGTGLCDRCHEAKRCVTCKGKGAVEADGGVIEKAPVT